MRRDAGSSKRPFASPPAHATTKGMSKAFVKEDGADLDGAFDDEDGDGDLLKGGRRLMTPEGCARFQEELRHLRRNERPRIVEIVSWAAGNGDRSENGDYIYGKKRLREIDRRIRFLMKRLDAAEVVDPARQTNHGRVFFGATVTYANEDGEENTVRIVGEDEARLEFGEISWVSPVAKALMGAEEGDAVVVRTPEGPRELEVVGVFYGN